MMKKILFVDDEVDLLKVSLLRLRKTGYDVSGAADGREALDLAHQRMPDLIILDVYLPEMNGDEVAKILKKDEKLKHVPVILISADIETLEKRCRQCGADGYLTKPFESGALVREVKRRFQLSESSTSAFLAKNCGSSCVKEAASSMKASLLDVPFR